MPWHAVADDATSWNSIHYSNRSNLVVEFISWNFYELHFYSALLTTWDDTTMYHVLHFKFLLAYVYFPLWFVGFACTLHCILPEEYI